MLIAACCGVPNLVGAVHKTVENDTHFMWLTQCVRAYLVRAHFPALNSFHSDTKSHMYVLTQAL